MLMSPETLLCFSRGVWLHQTTRCDSAVIQLGLVSLFNQLWVLLICFIWLLWYVNLGFLVLLHHTLQYPQLEHLLQDFDYV